MDLDDMFGAFDPSANAGTSQPKVHTSIPDEPRNNSSAKKEKDKKSSRKRKREDSIDEVEQSLRKDKTEKRSRRDDLA